MNILLRVSADQLKLCRENLARRHAYAYERVGFLITKTAWASAGPIVIPYDYVPVPDDQYVKDSSVGARISQEAVRNALNHALLRRAGVFHVHQHHFGPDLWFSKTDLDDQNRMIPDFFTVSKDQIHGSLVIGPNSVTGRPWADSCTPSVFTKISVIGSPICLSAPSSDGRVEFV
jgi:hypothetical protein